MRNLLTTFFTTLVVITFIMCLIEVFGVTEALARGFSWLPVAIVFVSAMPTVLTFSIPISCITSSLLVFEKMSADNEIVALRASGVSMWQIASRPLLLATLAATICLGLNTELAARGHFMRRSTTRRLGTDIAINLLVPGRFVRITEKLTIYVGRKSGHKISDVVIYDGRTSDMEREIRAGKGELSASDDDSWLFVKLSDHVRVTPLVDDRPDPAFMDSYEVMVEVRHITHDKYEKKIFDLTLGELIGRVRAIDKNDPDLPAGDLALRMTYAVEINRRLVLSYSAFAFVLLGIPFGMTTRRCPSSLGIALSLLIVFTFYLFLILVDSLSKTPALRPDLIVWIAGIVPTVAGLLLLRKQR